MADGQPDFRTLITIQFPFPYQNVTPYLQGDAGTWTVLLTTEVYSGGIPVLGDSLAATGPIPIPAGESRTVVVLGTAAGSRRPSSHRSPRIFFRWVAGPVVGPAVFAGFVAGYLVYDTIHSAVHHCSGHNPLLLYLKKHHYRHHDDDETPRLRGALRRFQPVYGLLPHERRVELGRLVPVPEIELHVLAMDREGVPEPCMLIRDGSDIRIDTNPACCFF